MAVFDQVDEKRKEKELKFLMYCAFGCFVASFISLVTYPWISGWSGDTSYVVFVIFYLCGLCLTTKAVFYDKIDKIWKALNKK